MIVHVLPWVSEPAARALVNLNIYTATVMRDNVSRSIVYESSSPLAGEHWRVVDI